MSLEVFGDEGNVSERWEDTGMAQEFVEIRNKYLKWVTDYKSSIPGPEFETVVQNLQDVMDTLSDMMQGSME